MNNLNPELHTCPDCGYQWKHGQHGGHSCAENLKKQLELISKERDELKTTLSTYKQAASDMTTMMQNREYVGHPMSWSIDNDDMDKLHVEIIKLHNEIIKDADDLDKALTLLKEAKDELEKNVIQEINDVLLKRANGGAA